MNTIATQKLNEFFSRFKNFNYKKDEVILRPGDVPQGISFVKTGFVRLYSFSKEGKELTLVIYKPEDFFPVVWTFRGDRPSIYYFETLSDVQIYRCPREEFVDFLDKNHDVFVEVNDHILERFQVALRRMQYLTFGNSTSKLASILMICGKDFGGEKDGGIEIQIPLTHKNIADLVGVTRETVSVELKKLEKRGLVGYNSKLIVIKDKEGLEAEAILT